MRRHILKPRLTLLIYKMYSVSLQKSNSEYSWNHICQPLCIKKFKLINYLPKYDLFHCLSELLQGGKELCSKGNLGKFLTVNKLGENKCFPGELELWKTQRGIWGYIYPLFLIQLCIFLFHSTLWRFRWSLPKGQYFCVLQHMWPNLWEEKNIHFVEKTGLVSPVEHCNFGPLKNVFLNMDRQTLAFAIKKWKDKGKICSWEMKSEKSFLITVLKLKLWTVILHQKLSEWLGEYDCRRAKEESFGVMESFGTQLEGVVTLIYSCVKNHVIMHQKTRKKHISVHAN